MSCHVSASASLSLRSVKNRTVKSNFYLPFSTKLFNLLFSSSTLFFRLSLVSSFRVRLELTLGI